MVRMCKNCKERQVRLTSATGLCEFCRPRAIRQASGLGSQSGVLASEGHYEALERLAEQGLPLDTLAVPGRFDRHIAERGPSGHDAE